MSPKVALGRIERVRERLIDFGWSCWRLWNYTLSPRSIYRKVRRYHQRGVRGWADEDTWSFDDHLSRVIIAGIGRLRHDKVGVPGSCFLDPNCEDYDAAQAKWDVILEQIIRGFCARQLLNDSVTFQKDWTTGEFFHDDALQAKLEAERDLGARLFMEYYDALWS